MARIPKAQNGKGLKCATNVGGCGRMDKTPRGLRISKREQRALDKEYSADNPGYQYSGDRRYTLNYRPERTDEKKVATASSNSMAKKGAKVKKSPISIIKKGGKVSTPKKKK